MNEEELLKPLRDEPLPDVPAALTARIRSEAHACFAERRGVARAGKARRSRLAMAAVIFLCATHVAWTVAFLERVQVRSGRTASVLR